MHSIKISVLKLSTPPLPPTSEAVSLTKQWRLNEDDLGSRRKTALPYQMNVRSRPVFLHMVLTIPPTSRPVTVTHPPVLHSTEGRASNEEQQMVSIFRLFLRAEPCCSLYQLALVFEATLTRLHRFYVSVHFLLL